MTKEEIENYFGHFGNSRSSGIEKIFCVIDRDQCGTELTGELLLEKNYLMRLLREIKLKPINKVRLNQLFMINGLQGFTFDFFKYYWLSCPVNPNIHPYDLKELHLGGKKVYEEDEIENIFLNDINDITSAEQLRWGFLRIYADALLYFGNITLGYNYFGSLSALELADFFEAQKYNTETIKKRGHPIDFERIDIADRHLISEMACKNLDDSYETGDSLEKFLLERFSEFEEQEDTPAWINDLLDKKYSPEKEKSASKFNEYKKVKDKGLKKDEEVAELEKIEGKREIAADKKISATKLSKKGLLFKSADEIRSNIEETKKYFSKARNKALRNTQLYLSLVDDMDVYVATSMRDDSDFEKMANTCVEIFGTTEKPSRLKNFNLRYFDPTMSAATGHDDKGLIECLMVKCAKVLVYTSGDRDSYGKDAEAAMALSSGKPVIFYCEEEWRQDFFNDVHPLTKLIDFKSGVANGAMVISSIPDVITILERILKNEMRYNLKREKNGTFKLKEVTSDSTIRLQTNDILLSNSFWNYFTRHVNNK